MSLKRTTNIFVTLIALAALLVVSVNCAPKSRLAKNPIRLDGKNKGQPAGKTADELAREAAVQKLGEIVGSTQKNEANKQFSESLKSVYFETNKKSKALILNFLQGGSAELDLTKTEKDISTFEINKMFSATSKCFLTVKDQCVLALTTIQDLREKSQNAEMVLLTQVFGGQMDFAAADSDELQNLSLKINACQETTVVVTELVRTGQKFVQLQTANNNEGFFLKADGFMADNGDLEVKSSFTEENVKVQINSMTSDQTNLSGVLTLTVGEKLVRMDVKAQRLEKAVSEMVDVSVLKAQVDLFKNQK